MIGTTGKVDPWRQMPILAKWKNRAKVIEVNPNVTGLSKWWDLILRDQSATVLTRIAEQEKILRKKREAIDAAKLAFNYVIFTAYMGEVKKVLEVGPVPMAVSDTEVATDKKMDVAVDLG